MRKILINTDKKIFINLNLQGRRICCFLHRNRCYFRIVDCRRTTLCTSTFTLCMLKKNSMFDLSWAGRRQKYREVLPLIWSTLIRILNLTQDLGKPWRWGAMPICLSQQQGQKLASTAVTHVIESDLTSLNCSEVNLRLELTK